MRILIVYPGASWSPFDVARGYEKALRELGHQVYAFNYHTVYAGMRAFLEYLQEHEGAQFPVGAAAIVASERVVCEVVERVPDVILNVTGLGLHRRAYDLVGRLGVPMVLLLTESPYMDPEQRVIAEKGRCAGILTNDRVSVPYLGESGLPVWYLPHSFDPERHCPGKVGEGYRTDVFFHGTLWDERRQLLDAVQWNGHRVKIGGARTDPEQPDVLIGEVIDNDEMIQWYRGTRIALNHHRRDKFGGGLVQQGEAWSLGPRAFEIAACGAFQLCDDARGELGEVFGDSVAAYHDAQSLGAQVDYYLGHDRERRDMAWTAYERVQGCAFVNRAREIVVPALESVL